jgi:Putative Ig domain
LSNPSGWVDPASDGGLPEPGEIITSSQADEVIEDLEVMRASDLADEANVNNLENEVAALQAGVAQQTVTNSQLTSEITTLQQQVAALQLAVGTSPSPPTTTTSTITPIVGVPYTYTLTSNPSATYTIGSGSLPPGLNLSTAGVLSGTPTTVGTYTFSITATDTVGSVTSPAFTVTVVASAALAATSGLQIGTDYAAVFTSSQASTVYSITSGSLPTNMTLSSKGVLSGTPTTAGTFNFTVTATDSTGNLNTPIILIVDTSPTPTLAPSNTSPPLITGTPAQGQSLVVSDGSWSQAPYQYNYQWNSGGTPVANAIADSYTVQTIDEGKNVSCTITAINIIGSTSATSASVSIPTPPPTGTAPAFTADSPPTSAYQGVAYSYTFTASGSTPLTYSIASGSTPSGITINPTTGVFSGTPSAAGVSSFIVEVANSVGSAISPTISITTIAVTAPAFTAVSPPAATVGAAYSYTFGVSGSPTPTVSINSGSITGSGLTLVGNTLSGTPTTAATYTFTLSATNQGGTVISPSISIVVGVAAVGPLLTTPANISGVLAVNQTLTAYGTWSGATTYTYQWYLNSAAISSANLGTFSTFKILTTGVYYCVVTGIDTTGNTPSTTPSYTVTSGGPTIVTAATISGTAAIGDTLTAEGTWSGATSYTYQWMDNSAPISGATFSTYPNVPSAGAYSCVVTGKNSGGSTPSITPAVYVTGAVTAPVPGSVLPAITDTTSGTATISVNDSLTVSDGSWS